MRVALVHDWLTGMRGGEKVLEVLCELFPDADLYTLLHIEGSTSPAIERRRITTSFVQHLPLARQRYRHYLPLFPLAIERFDLSAYDLVISSSHCVAKAVRTPAGTRHLCYCHSPMRYAWDQFDAYFGPERVGALASRFFYRPVMSRLARWDAETAPRVQRFVANSRHVAGRIRRYYGREATVVYPPVDTVFYYPSTTPPDSHFLIVSALVPYKRIDLAIAAVTRSGARLRIVGDGPDRERLERQAGPNVEFAGSVTNEALRTEYQRARAVVMPGEEDFGIVPVEAQACGTPVVALALGGAVETVKPDETGVLFGEPTVDSLTAALARVSTMPVDRAAIRLQAERFGRDRHIAAMRTIIDDTMAAPPGSRW
jgi:glycosyltransferase involved in cell wall biosynthesis